MQLRDTGKGGVPSRQQAIGALRQVRSVVGREKGEGCRAAGQDRDGTRRSAWETPFREEVGEQ